MNFKLIKGSTRWVIIIYNLAFKFPSLYSYKNFLNGLLANLQENELYKVHNFKEKLCPILFKFPLGFLNVMPKVEVLKPNTISKLELKEFCKCCDFHIDVEIKYNSFGYYKNKLIIIDYG